jgi:predicted phage terminase large subunit-like protein
VREWLRDTGVGGKTAYTKRVPSWVFRASNRQIALFLGAYFACDGTVTAKGLDRHGRPRPDATVEFYSVSKALLQDVQHLLLRLGVQARLNRKNGRNRGNRHESWRLLFSRQDDVARFTASVPVPGVKQQRLRTLGSLRTAFDGRLLADPLTGSEPVGELECRCLTVEGDHTFTVDDLVVHNSIVISQRFPSWALGIKPDYRIRLCCYNEEHATRFSKINLELMRAPDYREWFPDPGARVPKVAKEDEWYTLARQMRLDAQPSFRALGLNSGFVGLGADLLIVDDPYKDRMEAYSETINRNIQGWWNDVVIPRMNPKTNAVVMFHRWHEQDFAGFLMEQGGWEYVRFPALADGLPGDPTWDEGVRQELGESLAPQRYSTPYLEAVKKSQGEQSFGSLYQGQPNPPKGAIFNSDHFRYYRVEGDHYVLLARDGSGDRERRVRRDQCQVVITQDTAGSTKKRADWTVLSVWAVTPWKEALLIHVYREQQLGPQVMELMQAAIRAHGATKLIVEANGLALPIVQAVQQKGFPVVGVWVHTDKKARAAGAAARYEAGGFYHPHSSVEGSAAWFDGFEKELISFQGVDTDIDDRVDTVSLLASNTMQPNQILPEFGVHTHVADSPLEWDEALPLVVGWAAKPVLAFAAVQLGQDGVVRVFGGGAAHPGEGAEGFRDAVYGWLSRRFDADVERLPLKHYGSPDWWGKGSSVLAREGWALLQTMRRGASAASGYAEDGDVDVDRAGTGWTLLPGEAAYTARVETLRKFLSRLGHGGLPALQVDPRAGQVVEALNGGFAFRVDGSGRTLPEPEVNKHLAVAEALGQACCKLPSATPALSVEQLEDREAARDAGGWGGYTSRGTGRRR